MLATALISFLGLTPTPVADSLFVNDIACASADPAAAALLAGQLPDAIQIILTFDGTAGAEIIDSLVTGAVSFVPLDTTTGVRLAGAADGDTVGLDADLPDAELAAALYHEWHHVRQHRPASEGGFPEEALLSEACRETFAYDADLRFMCLLVAAAQADWLQPPFDCSFIRATLSTLNLMRLECMLGSPDVIVPPLPTPCTAYCS